MADEAAADAQMSLALDPPFTRPRASYGARERFRAHFRALIYPVISELEMWTAKERLQSAQLLELLLIFTEARPHPNATPAPTPNPNRNRNPTPTPTPTPTGGARLLQLCARLQACSLVTTPNDHPQ